MNLKLENSMKMSTLEKINPNEQGKPAILVTDHTSEEPTVDPDLHLPLTNFNQINEMPPYQQIQPPPQQQQLKPLVKRKSKFIKHFSGSQSSRNNKGSLSRSRSPLLN